MRVQSSQHQLFTRIGGQASRPTRRWTSDGLSRYLNNTGPLKPQGVDPASWIRFISPETLGALTGVPCAARRSKVLVAALLSKAQVASDHGHSTIETSVHIATAPLLKVEQSIVSLASDH